MFTHNDTSDVPNFKAWDGHIQRFLQSCVDTLGDQAIKVNGPTQQLHMALFQQRFVAISRWKLNPLPCIQALSTESLIKQNAAQKQYRDLFVH